MNIGLTAHNSKKTLLESFCIAYKGIFKKHTLIATNATANHIAKATGMKVTSLLPGQMGGSKQMQNMIANNETNTLKKSFRTIEWLIHSLVTLIFSIAAIMIVPFVSVYTRGVKDADYIAPVFALILVLAYAVQCLRIPYFRVIKAAGHFKQTQNGSFISMVINIVVSVVLVFKFGLVGIAIGTLVAMLYQTVYFAWYLRSHIIDHPFFSFIKYLITDAVIFGLSYFLTRKMVYLTTDYLSWVILAIQIAFICLGIAIAVSMVFYFPTIKALIKKIKAKYSAPKKKE